MKNNKKHFKVQASVFDIEMYWFFLFACFLLRRLVFIWWRGLSRLHIDYKSVDFIGMGFYFGSLSSSSLSHRLLTMIIPPPFFILFSLLMIHLHFFSFFFVKEGSWGSLLISGIKKFPCLTYCNMFDQLRREREIGRGRRRRVLLL